MDEFIRKQVKTDRKVTLRGANATINAHLVDVSIKGIGVLSERGARIGTELDTQFELPAFSYFKTFDLHGVVTNRHNVGDEIYLHIEFSDLNKNDRLALQDFIDYKNRLSHASTKNYN